MFRNNVKVALRNLRKHKMFALMNILGLAIGLTVFVFGQLLVRYEATHDAFFEKSSRTYTIGAVAAPELNLGVDKLNAMFSAVGPIVEAELDDVEFVARNEVREYLVSRGEQSFYQSIRFVDPALTRIFDLDYLHGNERVLEDPSSVLITESAAIRYFGAADVVGETLTLDNQYDYVVGAVIRDLPQNSHFNSQLIASVDFELVMPIQALNRMEDFDLAGGWSDLSIGNMTYVVLPEGLDGDWLDAQLDGMYERIVPDGAKEVISEFWVVPLTYANLSIWDAPGIPVVEAIQILSLLVLIVACVNYTNLATAQSLGRSREVGMRKTMGAERGQLLTQFLVESLVITTIAMIVAVAILELIIPLFNNVSAKVMTLDYLVTLPWLVVTTVVVGVTAGLYPAWLITRTSPIEALRDTARKGRTGSATRSLMIGAQFAISAFMLAIVSVVYMQNQKVKEESYEFPRSEVYVLQRLEVEEIRERLDTLRLELEALPHVDAVAYSSQVPYEQNNSTTNVARQPADEAGRFSIQIMRMTPEFLDAYDIPLVAGRNLNRYIANDRLGKDNTALNVLVNEMALERLGFASAEAALNQSFYDLDEDDALLEYVIVGVVPTQNITGLFNSLKPWVYWYQEEAVRIGSVQFTGGNILEVVRDIENVWKRVIPDYPMQGRFLDEVFEDVYVVLRMMNTALAGFALIALMLALIGLFGLAAFMATQRTKEIGVRKVLGANSAQIARLLVWQFSKPVMWALAVALPLAYFASNLYLNFFAGRIDTAIPILIVAGAIAVMMAWGTVAGHAIRIARANPILALRYE